MDHSPMLHALWKMTLYIIHKSKLKQIKPLIHYYIK